MLTFPPPRDRGQPFLFFDSEHSLSSFFSGAVLFDFCRSRHPAPGSLFFPTTATLPFLRGRRELFKGQPSFLPLHPPFFFSFRLWGVTFSTFTPPLPFFPRFLYLGNRSLPNGGYAFLFFFLSHFCLRVGSFPSPGTAKFSTISLLI